MMESAGLNLSPDLVTSMMEGAMSNTNYEPPCRKLFRSRHRLTRRELQGPLPGLVDWSTALDVSIDEDSSVVLYGVPVVGCRERNEDETRYSTISSYSDEDLFEPDLRTKLQSNLSLESLIQENKKLISAHQESLGMFNTAEHHVESIKSSAKLEIARLKDRNMHLFGRAGLLQEKWEKIRQCRDSSILLIEIGKNGLYWFGIPSDLRNAVYQLCLYQLNLPVPQGPLYDAVARCCGDELLAKQIYKNIRRNFPFLTDPEAPLAQSDAIQARLSSKYPGLHYHLTQTLKLKLIPDFVRPLLINSFVHALESHTTDRIGMELLDVVVLSMYYRDLDRLMADEFLFYVLEQTHFKFFGETPEEVQQQLDDIQVNLIDVLEASRRNHGNFIADPATT